MDGLSPPSGYSSASWRTRRPSTTTPAIGQQRHSTAGDQEDQLQAHKPKIIPRPGRPRPAWHVPDALPGSQRSAEHPARWHRFFGTHRTAGQADDRVSGRHRFLGGVFTSDAEPADPAPAALDYTSSTGTLTPSDASYAPSLNQVFFMGDGLTGNNAGETQQFVVPAGATTLWLGVVDAGFYQGAPISTEGNVGGFNATVGIQPFVPANSKATITVTEKTQGAPSAITSETALQASVVGDRCANGNEPDPAVRDLATGQLLSYPYVLFDNFSTPTADASGKQHYTFEFRSGLPGDMAIELDCAGQAIGSTSYTMTGNAYVGLGDSYSSGEGDAQGTFLPGTIFPATDGSDSSTGCHRSTKGWEATVAAYERLDGDHWTFAACSGAAVDQLYDINDSYTRFGETELPQLLAVTANAKLVALSVGGNDVGFQAILTDCAFDTFYQSTAGPVADPRVGQPISSRKQALTALPPASPSPGSRRAPSPCLTLTSTSPSECLQEGRC
jgi:hypothetical protein